MSRDEPPSIEYSLAGIEIMLGAIHEELEIIAKDVTSMSKGTTKFLDSYEKILSQQGLV